jgi:hypothetical protein
MARDEVMAREGEKARALVKVVPGRSPRPRSWRGCGGRAATAVLGALALLASGPQLAAGAGGQGGFALTPSTTEPYAVCGLPTAGHAACLAIIVPGTSASALSRPQGASPLTASPLTASSLTASPLAGSGVGGGYDPADLRSAYALPSETAGAGQTVAIVDAFDDPNAEADLAVYRSRYGLPACTSSGGCFRKVNQSGGTSYPAANSGWAVEISLDLDMVSAACPKCHLLLVEATTNEDINLYTAEDEAAALGATEISNSWGGEEYVGESEDDVFFHHPGVPITFSAGDSGYEAEYPAASPDVIAVGGTALKRASNSRGWSETAWSKTGSGCSALESKPAWQTDSGCADRTIGDVSAVAAPETPLSVADSYKLPAEFSVPEAGWTLVGGTSASSPLVAGTMALASAHARSFPGAQALYLQAHQRGTGTLDDVVSGSDGKCGSYLCTAGPGYDGPTGLGTPEGAFEVLAPAVVTKQASTIGRTGATLNATVDPDGSEVSSCVFEYGTTMSYGKTKPCSSLPGSGKSPVAVSSTVEGLAANTTYHFRIVATTVGGEAQGADETLRTLPNAPAVVTKAAGSVTQTGATLNATVDPEGAEVSECVFEYGATASYGMTKPCSSSPGVGESAVAVSVSVDGLSAGSTYHFRISARNGGGVSSGADEIVTTQPQAGPPVVATGVASPLTPSAATLNATVNPNGAPVSECTLEYGTTSSYGSRVPCVPGPGAAAAAVGVSGTVGSLTPGGSYHFRISATNLDGTVHGSDAVFTTPASLQVHWYRNLQRDEEGAETPFVAWGTVTLSTTAGGAATECQEAATGYVENPAGAVFQGFEREGVATTEAASYYHCTNSACQAQGGHIGIVSEGLPWLGALTEAVKGAVRLTQLGVRELVRCERSNSAPSERESSPGVIERSSSEYDEPGAFACTTSAGGTSQPTVVAGASTGKPMKLVLDEAGALTCGAAGQGSTSGSLKLMGYAESEVITAKNP